MSNTSVAEVKAWASIQSGASDAIIQAAIDSVEPVIAEMCARTFQVTATNASARHYLGTGTPVLEVADFATTSGLVVVNNGTTVSSTSYQLEPIDGLDSTGQTVPYHHIRLVDGSVWTVGPFGAYTVTITAKWGWGTSLPARYTQAVCIAAHDLLAAREQRNGVIGFTEAGVARVRANPQVLALLEGGLIRKSAPPRPIQLGAWFA